MDDATGKQETAMLRKKLNLILKNQSVWTVDPKSYSVSVTVDVKGPLQGLIHHTQERVFHKPELQALRQQLKQQNIDPELSDKFEQLLDWAENESHRLANQEKLGHIIQPTQVFTKDVRPIETPRMDRRKEKWEGILSPVLIRKMGEGDRTAAELVHRMWVGAVIGDIRIRSSGAMDAYDVGRSHLPQEKPSTQAVTNFWSDWKKNPVIAKAEKILNSLGRKRPIFIKTSRLGHTLHPIIPVHFILAKDFLTAKNVVLCRRNAGFAETINRIIIMEEHIPVFFVHPENLDKDEQNLLSDLCVTRMAEETGSQKRPQIIVITSCASFLPKGLPEDRTLEINERDIRVFCDFTAQWIYEQAGKKGRQWMNVYASKHSGNGKSHQIMEAAKSIRPPKEMTRLFVDLTTTELPMFEANSVYHLDLSPELFDNEFGFFDAMWMGTIFGGVLLSDGSISNPRLCERIFFEIPALADKQYPIKEGFHRHDFPIALAEDRDFVFIRDKTHIRLDTNETWETCLSVFKERPRSYDDLLSKAGKLFFGDDFPEAFLTTRIVVKAKSFLERTVQAISRYASDDVKRMFLLLLRTVFHYCLFVTETPPILLMPQKLGADSLDDTNWVLIGLPKDTTRWNGDSLAEDFARALGELRDTTCFADNFLSDGVKVERLVQSADGNSEFAILGIILSFFPAITENEDTYAKLTGGMMLKEWLLDRFPALDDMNIDTFNAAKSDIEAIRIRSFQHVILDYMHCIARIVRGSVSTKEECLAELQEVSQSSEKIIADVVHMTYTVPFVVRFFILLAHVTFRESIVLEGYTGCGKTSVIQLMLSLLKLSAGTNVAFGCWKDLVIDCHGNVHSGEVEKQIERCSEISQRYVVFFDELNTSPASCYILGRMMNPKATFQSVATATLAQRISFVGAINPYSVVNEMSRCLSRVGVKQVDSRAVSCLAMLKPTPDREEDIWYDTDVNMLEYNVREMAKDLRCMVMVADPQDARATSVSSRDLTPSEEQETVRGIIYQYLETWGDLDPQKKRDVCELIWKLLIETMRFGRGFTGMKSVLSYRDVKRTLIHFRNIYRKLCKYHHLNPEDKTDTKQTLERVISDSIVLSVYLCLLCRFSTDTVIPGFEANGQLEVNLKNVSSEQIRKRCQDYHVRLIEDKISKCFRVKTRDELERVLHQVEWPEWLRMKSGFNPADPNSKWNERFELYSYWKCQKYVMSDKSLFQFPALMEHLFVLHLCYSIERQPEFQTDSIMACLLLGPPGISKTKSIELFLDFKHRKAKEKKDKHGHPTKVFFSSTYLATRVADTESLNASYQDCALERYTCQHTLDPRQVVAVCLIDELGLASVNPSRPLKLLHYYFDKGVPCATNSSIRVLSFCTSNYNPDMSNQGRLIIACMKSPTPKEIEAGFRFRSSDNTIVKEFSEYEVKWQEMKTRGNSDTKYLLQFLVDHHVLREGSMVMRPVLQIYKTLENLQRLAESESGQSESEMDVFCTFASSLMSGLCPDYQHAIEFAQQYLRWIGDEYDTNLKTICNRIADKWNGEDKQLDILQWLLQSAAKKPVLIRTSGYEAWDQRLRIFKMLLGRHPYVQFVGYPDDFAQGPQAVSRRVLQKFMQGIEGENTTHDDRLVLFIGKVDAVEACLDVLNASGQDSTDKPLISLDGFSIRLYSNPQKGRRMIFVLNQSDIESHDEHVPLPLVDRLSSVYIDTSLISSYLARRYAEYPTGELRSLFADIQQPRKEEIHLLSDASLLHKYMNSFHNNLESCIYHCRPDLWFKMYDTLLVTDQIDAEAFFSSRGFSVRGAQRSSDVSVPEKVVYVVDNLSDLMALRSHERSTHDKVHVVLKVNEAIPPYFLKGQANDRVLTASKISRLTITRYIFWEKSNMVVVWYKDRQPRPASYFTEIHIDSPDFSSALHAITTGYVAVITDRVGTETHHRLKEIENRANETSDAFFAVLIHVKYRSEFPDLGDRNSKKVVSLVANEERNRSNSLFMDSVSSDFENLEGFYKYFFDCRFQQKKINLICTTKLDNFDQQTVDQLKRMQGNCQPGVDDLMRKLNSITTLNALNTAEIPRVCLVEWNQRPYANQVYFNISEFMRRHLSVFWVQGNGAMPKTACCPSCCLPTLEDDVRAYKQSQLSRGISHGCLLWNVDAGDFAENVVNILRKVVDSCDVVMRNQVKDQFSAATPTEFKLSVVKYSGDSGKHECADLDEIVHVIKDCSGECLVYDGVPHPRRIADERNKDLIHNGLDMLKKYIETRAGSKGAFILTRSPMMATLPLDGSVHRYYDRFIESTAAFSSSLRIILKEEQRSGTGICISADSFVPERHRQLMDLLSCDLGATDTRLLIYHLSNNAKIPHLLGTPEWFGCWIESVAANNWLLGDVIEFLMRAIQGCDNVDRFTGALVSRICDLQNPNDSGPSPWPKGLIKRIIREGRMHIQGSPRICEFLMRLRHPVMFNYINLQSEFADLIAAHLPPKFETMVKIVLNGWLFQDNEGPEERLDVVSQCFEMMEKHSRFLVDSDSIPVLNELHTDDVSEDVHCVELLMWPVVNLYSYTPFTGPLAPLKKFIDEAEKFIVSSEDKYKSIERRWLGHREMYHAVEKNQDESEGLWRFFFGSSWKKFLIRNVITENRPNLDDEGEGETGGAFGTGEDRDSPQKWSVFQQFQEKVAQNEDTQELARFVGWSGDQMVEFRRLLLTANIPIEKWLFKDDDTSNAFTYLRDGSRDSNDEELWSDWKDRMIEQASRTQQDLTNDVLTEWLRQYSELFVRADKEEDRGLVRTADSLVNEIRDDCRLSHDTTNYAMFDPFGTGESNCINVANSISEAVRRRTLGDITAEYGGELPSSRPFFDHITANPNTSILDLIRRWVTEGGSPQDSKIIDWMFDSRKSLLWRQFHAALQALLLGDANEIRSEFIVLSHLVNPWNKDTEPCVSLWNAFAKEIYRRDENDIIVCGDMDSALGSSTYYRTCVIPCVPNASVNVLGSRTRIRSVQLQYPPFERMILSAALQDNPSGDAVAKLRPFLRGLLQIRLTKHLSVLYSLVYRLHKVFENQTCLLYLIMKTLTCRDLTRSFGVNVAWAAPWHSAQDFIENKQEFDRIVDEFARKERASGGAVDVTRARTSIRNNTAQNLENLTDNDVSLLSRLRALVTPNDFKQMARQAEHLSQVKTDLESLKSELTRFQRESEIRVDTVYERVTDKKVPEIEEKLASLCGDGSLADKFKGLHPLLEVLIPLDSTQLKFESLTALIDLARKTLRDVYAFLEVPVPVIDMLEVAEFMFPAEEWGCAYNQLNQFVRYLCDIHNDGIRFAATSRERPVKLVREADLVCGMTFWNTCHRFLDSPPTYEVRRGGHLFECAKQLGSRFSDGEYSYFVFNEEDFLGLSEAHVCKDLFFGIDTENGNANPQSCFFSLARNRFGEVNADYRSAGDRYELLRWALPIFGYSEVVDQKLKSEFYIARYVDRVKPSYCSMGTGEFRVDRIPKMTCPAEAIALVKELFTMSRAEESTG